MTEKKYIIDGAFLARLYRLIEMECPNDDLRDELAALKPVEPVAIATGRELYWLANKKPAYDEKDVFLFPLEN